MLKMFKEGTKLYHTAEILLIAAGLSMGLSLFGIDLLGFIPEGLIKNIVYGAAGVSAVVLGIIKAQKAKLI